MAKQLLISKIKLFDIFARKINLTYQGSEKFKTSLGGILALIAFLILTVLGSSGVLKWLTGWIESISTYRHHRSLFYGASFNPGLFEFNIAFGLVEKELTPEFGEFQLKHVSQFWKINDDGTNERHTETVDIPFENCQNQLGEWLDAFHDVQSPEEHREQNPAMDRRFSVYLSNLFCPKHVTKDFTLQNNEFADHW